MNNSLLNEFYPQISQKGYTSKEVSKPDTSKTFPDRYDSYEEYTDALHEFLNGIWLCQFYIMKHSMKLVSTSALKSSEFPTNSPSSRCPIFAQQVLAL